ncbi:MAG: response regulator [Polyangiaceae bacterium]
MSELRRIMLVEDEPSLRLVAKVALEKVGGFLVMSCDSGADAIAAYADFAPDLILLDVMMPVIDGPTTLVSLRQLHGEKLVPVVFLTAKVQTKEVQELMSLGATGVLPKPFESDASQPTSPRTLGTCGVRG